MSCGKFEYHLLDENQEPEWLLFLTGSLGEQFQKAHVDIEDLAVSSAYSGILGNFLHEDTILHCQTQQSLDLVDDT